MPTRMTPARRASWTGASDEQEDAEPERCRAMNARNVARLNDAVTIAPANAPEPERGREEAERPRVDVQRVGGEQRHERVEVEADEPDAGHDDEHGAHLRGRASANGEPFPRAREERDACDRARPDRARPSRIASRAARTARKLIVLTTKQRPTPATAIRIPASAGPTMRDALSEARVERDRVRQLPRADHLERQRLPPGCVEHEGDAAERREHVDDRQRRRAGQRHGGERRGDEHRGDLRPDRRGGGCSSRSTTEPAKSPNTRERARSGRRAASRRRAASGRGRARATRGRRSASTSPRARRPGPRRRAGSCGGGGGCGTCACAART